MTMKTLTAALMIASTMVYAQVDSLKIGMDLRTRSELDNGQRTLIPEGKSAVNTIFSRARLNVDYYYQNLQVYLSVQDVRNWGEYASTDPKNQNFTLYEGWAKYQFTPKTSIKIGRQILSYDDERLFGALDWQMQARSFDAAKAIFTFNKNSRLETVLTYNNDKIRQNNQLSVEPYTVLDSGERTRSLQVAHYSYKQNKFQFSTIAMNSVLQHATTGVNYNMLTLGTNIKQYYDNFGLFGSAYYQTGKNTLGQDKSAYQFSVNADLIFNNKINTVIGTEWLSGRDYNTDAGKNLSFSPMYGTNHKFNGFMDYFFVGNHFNSFGLNDYYLKTNAKINPKNTLSVNLHALTTNGKIAANTSSYLGTEADLVWMYKVNKMFVMNIGHSFMFASDSMKLLKAVPNPKGLQTWSWLSLTFTPNFKLIGK